MHHKHLPTILACFAGLLMLLNAASADCADKPVTASPLTGALNDKTATAEPDPTGQTSTTSGPGSPGSFDYPASILQKLGITASDITQNQSGFEKDRIHAEWMRHVDSAIPEIDPEKRAAIIKIHTSLLFIKDMLDKSYYNGSISKQEHTSRLSELMQWFQKANRRVLSIKEYNMLFEVPAEEEQSVLSGNANGKIQFPVKNPATTDQMIHEAFDDATINDLSRFYHLHSQELKDIREIYDSGDFNGADEQQVKNDIKRIEKELADAFKKYCRQKLTDEQFQLLFNSPSPEPGPNAIIDQPVFEFPPVIAGTEVTHVFSIRNQGGADLNIPGVYAG